MYIESLLKSPPPDSTGRTNHQRYGSQLLLQQPCRILGPGRHDAARDWPPISTGWQGNPSLDKMEEDPNPWCACLPERNTHRYRSRWYRCIAYGYRYTIATLGIWEPSYPYLSGACGCLRPPHGWGAGPASKGNEVVPWPTSNDLAWVD